MNHIEIRTKGGRLEYRCRKPSVDASGAFCGWSNEWEPWSLADTVHDSDQGRQGSAPGTTTLRFVSGPFDGQVWKNVNPRDHGPTNSHSCIIIRDDCDDGWPVYESDPDTFGDSQITVKFKGWD